MQPKPNPADFTHNGELQQPHYDNAVRAWEKLERMENDEIFDLVGLSIKYREEKYDQIAIGKDKVQAITASLHAQVGFMDGFKAGAEWANEQKGWISVNDALPPKEYKELSFTKFCIVKSMEGEVTAYYHYRDEQWYTEKETLNGHGYRPIFNVTHWKNI